jgi:hypothetical protein
MSALAGEVIAERRVVAGELGPQLDQLAHPRRAFLHRDANRLLAAEPRSGQQRVVYVLFEAVVGGEDSGDSALRVSGVGLGPPTLVKHGDGPMPGRLQREREAGDARPEDEEIMLLPHQVYR